eukprot:TRINITY_DN4638_c0_g2_i1.p1 TRINITY_DN4638_c0_g2~~TRINITY_DN4638_c0_g2_i1.p1  ORF type:complete len:352 (-),score=50.54 TRINITY_DN4638_c0_g2_i1:346-1401(-)
MITFGSSHFVFAVLSSWILTILCAYFLYASQEGMRHQILEATRTEVEENRLSVNQHTTESQQELESHLETLNQTIHDLTDHLAKLTELQQKLREDEMKPIRIVVHPGQRVYIRESYPEPLPRCSVACIFQTGQSGHPSHNDLINADAIIWEQDGPSTSSAKLARDHPEKIRIIYHVESETNLHPQLSKDYDHLGNFYDILLSYHLDEDQAIQNRRSKGYIFSNFLASYGVHPLPDYYKDVPIPFSKKTGTLNDTFVAFAGTFMSNCDQEKSGRNKLIRELNDLGFTLSSFGKCGPNNRSESEFPHCLPTNSFTSKECIQKYFKFSIALENSIDESYVSEKMFHGIFKLNSS